MSKRPGKARRAAARRPSHQARRKGNVPRSAASAKGDTFAVLTFAGLGGLAKKELAVCKPQNLRVLGLRNYDLLLFDAALPALNELPRLRLAEDCFQMIGNPLRIETKSDVGRLRSIVTPDSIQQGLSYKNQLFKPRKPKSITYNCFIKQDEDREVHRKLIADTVCSLIGTRFAGWRRADPAAIELWGFYLEQKLHLGFRLSDNRMRYRGREPSEREGALRPTIAAALALLADPKDGDVVIDPMCGTGALLAEVVSRNREAEILGGDLDEEAAEMCADRFRSRAVEVHQWDARRLPLPEQSVDCFVCNLPFGKQFSTSAANESLYPALISDWVGKLKANGRMVLLTSDTQNIERSLTARRLRWRVAGKVKVLGEWARIYMASK